MRFGRQQPTFQAVGAYHHSDGGEACELFGQYGATFVPAQEYELGLYLAKTADGRCAAITIGLSRPRQNGKSYAARYYAIWCAAIEGRAVLYTAHNGGTTRKMFKFVCDFMEGNADFAHLLKPNGQGIYKAQGAEGIYLVNGGLIEFSTRTNSGARGGTYDVIVVDEAQELTDEQAEAMRPTTIASVSGDPQMIYLGTPPGPKCPGTVFRELHARAHDGSLGNAWWLEWAATEVGDTLDAARWYECNPLMGHRIREEVMADAAATTRPDSFAREYLGWWSEDSKSVAHVIQADAWGKCATETPPDDGIVCVGVKFAPDGSTGALSVCLRPEAGTPYIECVVSRSMSDGVAPFGRWLLERRDKVAAVAIDGRVGAEPLVRLLRENGFPAKAIATPTSREFTGAVSMLVNAVSEGRIEHYGQPALDASATLTARRRVGSDGFGFESTDRGDATLIESAALAYWQARTTKRNPKRKMRVG